MSREIKFRVWDKTKKQMFYPSNAIDWTIGIQGEVFWHCGTSVRDNVVVQQYTGLKDKKGTEIYEGDIIEYHYGNESRIGYVDFFAGIYHLYNLDKTADDVIGQWIKNDVKVIGNMFEH